MYFTENGYHSTFPGDVTMSSESFSPIEEAEIFCRFCQKTQPASLDRCIAGNGRVVDKDATFEYSCSKCGKTFCFSGNDLKEQKEAAAAGDEPREYLPKNHYVIGEVIAHKKFKENGLIVGKDHGAPTKILVKFEKSGLKKLVEDI
jgi:hypothetical protein